MKDVLQSALKEDMKPLLALTGLCKMQGLLVLS